MNIEQLDIFLYQPTKIRYGITSIILILALSIFYFFIIIPINAQCDNAQFNYQTLVDDLAMLDSKISHYPSQESLINENERLKKHIQSFMLFSDYSSETVAKWLLKSQLKLIDFTSKEDINQILFQLTIQGSYRDFIAFITRLSKQNININVNHILIINDKSNLVFSLSVISEHKKAAL